MSHRESRKSSSVPRPAGSALSNAAKAEEKREEAVGESLTAIFQDEQGKMPDLTKLETHKGSRALYISIALGSFVVLLLLAAWVGFLLFKPFRGFQGTGLELIVEGPQRVALGKETTYFVNWKNVSSEPLAATELRVSFPADFSIQSMEPKPTESGNVWRLGSVSFGGKGTIIVKGYFTGALGTETAIQVVGTYRPASFNSDFEVLSTYTLSYTDTVLEGVLERPEKSLPGDKVRLGYTMLNRGEIPLSGLEARVTLPEGFVRDTTNTNDIAEGRVVRFPLPELQPGASSTVSVMGAFISGVSGLIPLHAETGRIGSDGRFLPAQKSEGSVTVLGGDVLLKMVVNGKDTNRTIGNGDVMRIAIGFENTATEDIQNVTLRLRAEPVMSSTSTASVTNVKLWADMSDTSSGTVSGNDLTWSKQQLAVLERLTPQQDGTIELSLPTLMSTSGTDILGFRLIAEATMERVGDTSVHRTIRTEPMVFVFRSDASIGAEARYYSEEGVQLGSGPLPPVVGQTTSYRVGWTIAKTTHELKNIRVTATLPKSVSWPKNASVDVGEIAFDESTRVVTWTVNRLPADVNEARAEFDVHLTPTEYDVGRFADVFGETRMEVLDVPIAETLVLTKPGLSTDLLNDEGAKSKGVVRKP